MAGCVRCSSRAAFEKLRCSATRPQMRSCRRVTWRIGVAFRLTYLLGGMYQLKCCYCPSPNFLRARSEPFSAPQRASVCTVLYFVHRPPVRCVYRRVPPDGPNPFRGQRRSAREPKAGSALTDPVFFLRSTHLSYLVFVDFFFAFFFDSLVPFTKYIPLVIAYG